MRHVLQITGAGIPRREFALVVPDTVGIVARQNLANDFGHALVVIRCSGTGDVMLRDFAEVARSIAREPFGMFVRQRLRCTAWVDSREHVQTGAVSHGDDFGEQVATAETAAHSMIRDTCLIEGDDAAAVDAKGGGTEALHVAHEPLCIYFGLIAFAQVDEEHTVGPLPPFHLRLRHEQSR